MDRRYWDSLADDFDEAVLQVSDVDASGVIEAAARRLGGPRKHAIDFGCGPGAVTRLVAPYFGTTLGVDFSEALLDEARRRSDGAISYAQRDLSRPVRRDGKWAHVGFCVNVFLHPHPAVRRRMAEHVIASVRPGGHLVVVVPAFESALRTYQVLREADERDGRATLQARRRLDRLAAREITSITDGVVDAGGTPTKHFLGDELVSWLETLGVAIERLERVAFPWSEEIDPVPRWLRGSSPWDWLVAGRRRR